MEKISIQSLENCLIILKNQRKLYDAQLEAELDQVKAEIIKAHLDVTESEIEFCQNEIYLASQEKLC